MAIVRRFEVVKNTRSKKTMITKESGSFNQHEYSRRGKERRVVCETLVLMEVAAA